MNKYKILIQADKLKQIVPIPHEFEHKELEVIISLPQRKKIDPRKYSDIFHISKDEIDRDLMIIRDEWERNGR